MVQKIEQASHTVISANLQVAAREAAIGQLTHAGQKGEILWKKQQLRRVVMRKNNSLCCEKSKKCKQHTKSTLVYA